MERQLNPGRLREVVFSVSGKDIEGHLFRLRRLVDILSYHKGNIRHFSFYWIAERSAKSAEAERVLLDDVLDEAKLESLHVYNKEANRLIMEKLQKCSFPNLTALTLEIETAEQLEPLLSKLPALETLNVINCNLDKFGELLKLAGKLPKAEKLQIFTGWWGSYSTTVTTEMARLHALVGHENLNSPITASRRFLKEFKDRFGLDAHHVHADGLSVPRRLCDYWLGRFPFEQVRQAFEALYANYPTQLCRDLNFLFGFDHSILSIPRHEKLQEEYDIEGWILSTYSDHMLDILRLFDRDPDRQPPQVRSRVKFAVEENPHLIYKVVYDAPQVFLSLLGETDEWIETHININGWFHVPYPTESRRLWQILHRKEEHLRILNLKTFDIEQRDAAGFAAATFYFRRFVGDLDAFPVFQRRFEESPTRKLRLGDLEEQFEHLAKHWATVGVIDLAATKISMLKFLAARDVSGAGTKNPIVKNLFEAIWANSVCVASATSSVEAGVEILARIQSAMAPEFPVSDSLRPFLRLRHLHSVWPKFEIRMQNVDHAKDAVRLFLEKFC
jgi:hypothetical protein